MVLATPKTWLRSAEPSSPEGVPTAMKIMVGIGSMGGTDGRDCNIDSASSAAHAAESVVAVDFDTAAVVPQKHTGKISELNEIKKAVGTV